jgi:ParB/RepB/Spo0J family partition protein
VSNLRKNITSIADLMATTSGPQITVLECELIECRVQVRTEFNDQTIKELADDIAARGVQQPIKVRAIEDGRYLVIFGERRLRAARLAELTKIPAIIEDMTDEAASEIQFMENIHREDLSTGDLAAAIGQRYKQLKAQEIHNAVDVIAGQVKKSKSWVSKHLAVATKLNSVVAELLQNGHTQDIELLLILNKLADVKPSEGYNLVHSIRAGKSITRKEAREALKKAEQDIKTKDEPAAEFDPDGETAAKQEPPSRNAPTKTPQTKPVDLEPQFDPSEILSALVYEEEMDVDDFLTNLGTKERAELDEFVRPDWQLGIEAADKGKDEVIQRVFRQATQFQDDSLALRALLAGSMGEPFDLAALVKSTRQLIGL